MERVNIKTRLSLLIGIGFITGMAISVIDNFAFGGEVSPIVIVALLLSASVILGAFFGTRGSIALVFVWVCIPLVHLVKHILNIPDTINPNTYASILKLAIFTFVVALIGLGCGIIFNKLLKGAIKNN